MKAVISILSLSVLFLSCNKSSIRGSGSAVTETRTVAPFTGVRIEGSGTAIISQGAQQNVEVTGYQNLVPIFRTTVSNGVLVLKFDDDYNIRNNNIETRITIPVLNYASINGSGTIRINNFNGASLEAEINGSGDIYAVNDTYASARLRINGSGTIHGRELTTANANTEISGSGRIDVTCTAKLDANIHGSGEINYWGQPAEVNTSVSGSGKVTRKL